MADLFDDAMTAQFTAAIRDVTDTFFKYPVIFGDGADEIDLRCGRKSIKNKLLALEEGEDIDQAYRITFNREYLTEKGVVDENDKLLIGYDTPVWMDGEQFTITKLDETSVFREKKLMVVLEVVN